MAPTRQEIEAADRALLAALTDLQAARGLFCEPSFRHKAHLAAQAWTGLQARIPAEDRSAMQIVKQPAAGNGGTAA